MMLTIFAIPKPFLGHIDVIQSNAITSWTLLRPRPEVILFGDEPGTAETARKLGIRHIPGVARNEFGTPMLDDLFRRAREAANNSLLAYVNADIVLLDEFLRAIERLSRWRGRFLMVGQRWDLDIAEPMDFLRPDWQGSLRAQAFDTGKKQPRNWIDYFVFTPDAYRELLPLAIGRSGWDNWLIWKARSEHVPVVDATEVVTVIHQNHDYSHHPKGRKGVWEGEESQRNRSLMGGSRQFATIADATHRMTGNGVRANPMRWFVASRRAALQEGGRVWFAFLNATRGLRHRIGLRQENLRRLLRGSAGAGPSGPGNPRA